MASESSPLEKVAVPRHLLQEVLADGCCPLHLRLQLSRIVSGEESDPKADSNPEIIHAEIRSVVDDSACTHADAEYSENPLLSPLTALAPNCLANVTAYLPLPAILTIRSCSHESLQWSMQLDVQGQGSHAVHDRIRTRLWMRRIADLTAGTKDESYFETQMKSWADEALRSRMEDEMREAMAHMEQQIQSFQAEVDRRLEEQEAHVRRMVEDRVQQELDAILVSEVAKVQIMVEERVRERVSAIFRREVRETVRELQERLDNLALENQTLSDAFAEANFRSKFFFWALHPPPLHTALMAGAGFGSCCSLFLPRRVKLLSVVTSHS